METILLQPEELHPLPAIEVPSDILDAWPEYGLEVWGKIENMTHCPKCHVYAVIGYKAIHNPQSKKWHLAVALYNPKIFREGTRAFWAPQALTLPMVDGETLPFFIRFHGKKAKKGGTGGEVFHCTQVPHEKIMEQEKKEGKDNMLRVYNFTKKVFN